MRLFSDRAYGYKKRECAGLSGLFWLSEVEMRGHIIGAAMFGLVATLVLIPMSSYADIAMVVNKASSLSDVDSKSVKLLYLGKRKSLNGVNVEPLALQGNENISESFITGVLNKSMQQHKSYWVRLVFTGKASAPRSFKDAQELKKWIAENPDSESIGYIDREDVDDSIKVVAIFSP